MIVINLKGGLGNQMFQYAFAYAFAKKFNSNLLLSTNYFKHDLIRSYQLYNFNLTYNKLINQDDLNFLSNNFFLYEEKNFCYSEIKLQKSNIIFDGYFQSENYFKDYRKEILNEFKLSTTLCLKSKKYLNIINNSPIAVSIHIRRGDYISNEKTNAFHGTCDLNYYNKSINYILSEKKERNVIFFIFSDDITWCKENFTFLSKKIFVQLPNNFEHEELYLMSQCKHNIIANSTFSWWAAWLNENKNKIIIAPNKWFNDKSMNDKDLIPKEWKKM
ncbi:alpha-1,2-fucosyltransferase [Arcobacter sp.]|uniref:alpha-1,2-fucosyltransferase n=1 Tax=Arcobacter sp. TaxID=1872629 RepID=UPI003D0E6365